MKKVKITGGTYGYHNSFGRLEPKNRKSEPFTLDDAEAERLVSLGVAEIVAEEVATPEFAGEKGFPARAYRKTKKASRTKKSLAQRVRNTVRIQKQASCGKSEKASASNFR